MPQSSLFSTLSFAPLSSPFSSPAKLAPTAALAALALSVALVPSAPASADTPIAAGSEIQVSSITSGVRALARSAVDADGNFVVVFEAASPADGSSYGVFGRHFDSAGAPMGDDFQINTHTAGLQVFPNIAMRQSGEFVVAWQSYNQDGNTDFGVFAQLYDSAGAAVGGELAVNLSTNDYQGNNSVAFGDDGGFMVIWEHNTTGLAGEDVLGRLFDSSGTAVGGEIQINTTTASDQNDPRIAARPDGSFVTVWESYGHDGSGEAVIAQLLNADGSVNGAEIVVNAFTTNNQEDPEVTVHPDGSFIVVWESDAQDGSGETAVGRVFNSDGTPQTDEIVLNTTTAGHQEDVDVAPAADGGFIATWENGPNSRGQRFDSAGQKMGIEFSIASDLGYQFAPHVEYAPNDRFIISWSGDGCLCAVDARAKLFDLPFFADGFESGDTTGWSSTTP